MLVYNIITLLSVSCRDRVDDFSNNSRRLGNAQDFLESFEWTDESLRDLESVNVEGTHRLLCGDRVKSTIESGLVINQSIVNGYM